MGDEAFNFFGGTVMKILMNGGQLFDGEEAPAEEKIGKFEKVGQQADKPTQPGQPRERLAGLKEKENNKDRGGKINRQFLKEGGFMALDFLGQALADVPVEDIVFDKVRDDNEGDGESGIGNLGSDEGAGGGVGDRKHRVKFSIL